MCDLALSKDCLSVEIKGKEKGGEVEEKMEVEETDADRESEGKKKS